MLSTERGVESDSSDDVLGFAVFMVWVAAAPGGVKLYGVNSTIMGVYLGRTWILHYFQEIAAQRLQINSTNTLRKFQSVQTG